MFKIDSAHNVGGFYSEGDPAAHPPVPATIVSADWLNAVQTEIVNVVQAADIALDKADSAQLLAALRKLFGPQQLAAPVTVINNVGTTIAWTTYDASGDVPAHATSVIVDTVGLMNNGSEYGNATLQARASVASPVINLLIGGDAAGDSLGYGSQGLIWLSADKKFDYRVDQQGFTGGLTMRIVGYN